MYNREEESAHGPFERNQPIRILLLADTHLGFDLPQRPRVGRPRRGDEFFQCFNSALRPALEGQVDLVVHGGDLFYRSRIGSRLAARVLDCWLPVLDRGIPVLIVPGNHERSAMPAPLFWQLPGLHLFDAPRSVSLEIRGVRLVLSGFPFFPGDLRKEFPRLLDQAGWDRDPADVRFLCLHQSVEGATVGPNDFVFHHRPDVIPGRLLPDSCDAVLAGHIHRHQVLRFDLSGRPLPAPVFYPGATCRTSLAEWGEVKGSIILEVQAGRGVCDWRFLPSTQSIRISRLC